MGKIIFIIFFLLFLSIYLFAEEPHVYTDQDLENYSSKSGFQYHQDCENIKSAIDYTICIWEDINKTCDYLSLYNQSADELFESLKKMNTLMLKITSDKTIPPDIKLQMMNDITNGVRTIRRLLREK